MNSTLDENALKCDLFDPDKIFRRFKVVEFPLTLVGLYKTQILDLEFSLQQSAYLKTLCKRNLVTYDVARESSVSHRAFELKKINDQTIRIKFHPTFECISKQQRDTTVHENRFIVELHLVKVDDDRCCNREHHAEIARYYISGLYEYCSITHTPKVINFDKVVMFSKKTQYLLLRNESKVITVQMDYIKSTGYDVLPKTFTLRPDSQKRIAITVKPVAFKLTTILLFRITNAEDFDVQSICEKTDDNFINYSINIKVDVIYNKKPRDIIIESLHNINEQSPIYTYIGEELAICKKRKKTAEQILKEAKAAHIPKIKEKALPGRDQCYNYFESEAPSISGKRYCKKVQVGLSTLDLLQIFVVPFIVDFGKIVANSYGNFEIFIENKSSFNVNIKLLNDKYIRYTEEKRSELKIKLDPNTRTPITLCFFGQHLGYIESMFRFSIENKFLFKHRYKVDVNFPQLIVQDISPRFGMISSDSFITSVPCKIYNQFNIPIKFEWNEIPSDIPFKIVPHSGTVPERGCKICNITYTSESATNKTHDVELKCKESKPELIPVTFNILSRKLSVKYLQEVVIFKPISLNLKSTEYIILENSARETVSFHVVDPSILGIIVTPMDGTLNPKSILVLRMDVQINYILDFSFDLCVKINNKENLLLPVSGSVIEPNINIQPKIIHIPRIPGNFISYVPITIQNTSPVRALIEVDDKGDENHFGIYVSQGNEKHRVYEFFVDEKRTKTVFIKVYDAYRREYDMYIPFKVNRLLGPPDVLDESSLNLNHYIGSFLSNYENNFKVKLGSIDRDICNCRIFGVITLPWIYFSVENFEIDYIPNGENCIYFTMTNVSKYCLPVTISTVKLMPNFTLSFLNENEETTTITENMMKIELYPTEKVEFLVKFHPKSQGRFVAVATLFLDKNLSIPYHNLTFVGKRQTSLMTSNPEWIIFAPCHVEVKLIQTVDLKIIGMYDLDSFSFSATDDENVSIRFLEYHNITEDDIVYTTVTAAISIYCHEPKTNCFYVYFHHVRGSKCGLEIAYCCTYCPLTLHAQRYLVGKENPYPYYPPETHTDLYKYFEQCTKFLEAWMFQQGFRRELYPCIPDTFHVISSRLSSSESGKRSKGINITFLSFLKRIAGPLMKNVKKVTVNDFDEPMKSVKEIYDTYRDVIHILNKRGATLWNVQALFLLSFDQFTTFVEEVTPYNHSETKFIKKLLNDPLLYQRLNKQSWIDFILQSYKVFVLDSCFFECVCVSCTPRNIVQILINWYNENIKISHKAFRNVNKPVKEIENLTTDLSDGIAIISTFLNYCSFLNTHFALYLDMDENDRKGTIIHNACLIVEALNMLRIYFPLASEDLIEPNFIQMLFFSVHLYVTLPMMVIKDRVVFSPPLLTSSTRRLSISSTNNEFLQFTHAIINNNSKNCFLIEKFTENDFNKKMCLNIKYTANFIDDCEYLLLVHGHNNSRIFDTYLVFKLIGRVSSVSPLRKCKVVGPIYRPVKVEAPVFSPFSNIGTFKLFQTDIEPQVPIKIEENYKRFYVRRLTLLETAVTLPPMPKDQKGGLTKLHFELICLSTQIGSTWVWCRSDMGDFFIKIMTHPRWDLALDIIQLNVDSWPVEPCNCGDTCECYRTYEITIPHRNDLMVKALRSALLENATELMMDIFDVLIETKTGKIILRMLFAEGGTIMSDVTHILLEQNNYRISSPNLFPRLIEVTFYQFTDAVFTLPITVPPLKETEKYSVIFTSECGMDIRTYVVLFLEDDFHSQ